MGGHIFAQAVLKLGREFKIITVLPEDTYADEVIGWSLAVIGIWSQLASGTPILRCYTILFWPHFLLRVLFTLKLHFC